MKKRWIIPAITALPILAASVCCWPSVKRKIEFEKRNRCFSHLSLLDSSKHEVAQQLKLKKGDPVTWDQVQRCYPSDWKIKCPKGGIYSLNPIGENPTCSYTNAVRYGNVVKYHKLRL